MIPVLINIILCLISGMSYVHFDSSTDNTEIDKLRQVDVSCDSVLLAILEDATKNERYGNRPAGYSVCMNKYKSGTMVRVIRSEKIIFDRRQNILGYAVVNDSPVVFYGGVSDYRLSYTGAPHPVLLKLGKFDYNDDADDVTYYYILGDIYARFSPESGWIWSDGKPDE